MKPRTRKPRTQAQKLSTKEHISPRMARFHAEADYADSMVRGAFGDLKASVACLERSLEWDPAYAPAVFSMGTVEYQRGKREEGQKLFHSLLSLQWETKDLCEIIDEAGDFLIGREFYADGLELYRGAVARFPSMAVFHQGVGCCAGHERLFDEALAASRDALALEPGNQKFVNDLGWTLFLAGQLCEAEETLTRAVSMDPADERARKNLELCRSKLRDLSAASAKPEHEPKPAKSARGRRRPGTLAGQGTLNM